LAISYIIGEFPDTEVIVMDDAFQHRKVMPSFQIVLTDFNNIFYNDYLLPAGKLRESARGLNRADVIVVTKCPQDLHEEKMMEIERSIRQYADKPIFFTTIRYGNLVALDHNGPLPEKVVLVSAIASHKPLEGYVEQHYRMVRHYTYRDHHVFTEGELKNFIELAVKEKAAVVMTEKDAVKLDNPVLKGAIRGTPFFYLPIKTEFLKNGKEFDEMLLNILKKHDS
jgi:tetraacyldisaccharide 4'-kinase